MSTDKYFSIIVKGKESSVAEEGNINKSTGLPDGPTTKIKLQVGSIAIPNFSKVWAQRIKDKKDQPTGELKFLPWMHKDGELVPIRYIEGINTLDKHYQETVLKIKLSEEELNNTAYINLDIGVNDFNVQEMDPMFRSMLEHHTYCEDNESRKKTSREIHYAIYNPAKMNANKIQQMRENQKAQSIVLSAEGDSVRLEILAGVFELDPMAQDEVLFNQLLEILEDEPKRILEVYKFHQARFTHILTKLEDGGDIAYTENEIVLTMDHTREVLLGEIPKKDIKNYLIEGILEPEIFAVYDKLR